MLAEVALQREDADPHAANCRPPHPCDAAALARNGVGRPTRGDPLTPSSHDSLPRAASPLALVAAAAGACEAAVRERRAPPCSPPDEPRGATASRTRWLHRCVRPLLTDRKDADYPAPAPAYTTVDLTDLDPCSGYLVGTLGERAQRDGRPRSRRTASSTTGATTAASTSMKAYYSRRSQTSPAARLGSTLRPVNNESQDIRVDQYGVDNRTRGTRTTSLRPFGKGDLDDAGGRRGHPRTRRRCGYAMSESHAQPGRLALAGALEPTATAPMTAT